MTKNNIKEYTLRNEHIEVSFVNLGASITRFIDLSSDINIVLSYDDYNMYNHNSFYFGCIIGRNSGRIENASISLADHNIDLSKNFLDKHQLHGGFNGFHTLFFAETINENSITFTATSKDGEDGYPGNVKLEVRYQLVKNELHITYEAQTDQETIINLTNHTYFNLNLNKEASIVNHQLRLYADYYLALEGDMMPKHVTHVENTPLDFRKSKLIGKDINLEDPQLKLGNGYDHPFLINKKEAINHVAELRCDQLTLNVYSDQDAVIFYSGNFLDSTVFIQDNIKNNYRCGLCLETQGIPNSMHIDQFKERNIYNKEKNYKQRTIWKLDNNN